MQVTTKFDIGQKVYWYEGRELDSGVISEIRIDEYGIEYSIKDRSMPVRERNLAADIDTLRGIVIEAIIKQQKEYLEQVIEQFDCLETEVV